MNIIRCPRSHKHRALTDAELPVAARVLGQHADDILRYGFFRWECAYAATFQPEDRAHVPGIVEARETPLDVLDAIETER